MAGNLAKMCPTIMWKATLVKSGLEYLGEVTSKKNAESALWLFVHNENVRGDRETEID